MAKVTGFSALLILQFTFSVNFAEMNVTSKADEGALFLTPLLRGGRADKARKLSEVHGLAEGIELQSYSGLITVNKEFNSNIFFWYFPAKNNVEEAPVILWVEGGPGVTGIVSLFEQNGPLQVGLDGKLSLREATWTANHSMIYVDVPIGAGYSFTDKEAGYSTTSGQVAQNIYEFLQQFYILFPERVPNEFYLAGISYGGHLIPPLAKLIIDRNQGSPAPATKVNLRNILLFCPWADPISLTDVDPFLSSLGLIDEDDLTHFKDEHAAITELITSEDFLGAKKRWRSLMHSPTSSFGNASGFDSANAASVLQDQPNLEEEAFVPLIQTSEFREALHVGNLTFDYVSSAVQSALASDFMTSVKPDIEEILGAGFPVFIITGQMDLTVIHTCVSSMISKLNWTGKTEFETSERRIWRVGTSVAGYTRTGGNLSFVLIRNAGHFLIADQMDWNLDLINRISRQIPF